MLDITLIRENPAKIKKACQNKQVDPKIVDRFLDTDEKWRKEVAKLEKLREEHNKKSKEKGSVEEGKKRKARIKTQEEEVRKLETEREKFLYQIPNPPAPDVPIGKDESENVVVSEWGEPKKFDFKPKDHLELGTGLGILDFEAGAKVAGSGFYFWYNEGALLELALVHYAFDLLSKEGFAPVITPDLARSRYYLGTGYLPKGPEAQTYTVENEDLGLIATAEVTLAGKHADEVISENKLPLKYIGYSHCFRQEAGGYGKYSKGLYRVHQFTKAEMFIYCAPEESDKWHKHILAMEEKIYQDLDLPYRVVEMCTGDLGVMAAKKFDIDVWMPSRGEYGEVTSTSNCTDFQARNLNIKLKRKDGTTKFVHMLNGTAIATSRTPLAILENYQQKDGSVVIPKVLRDYVGKDIIKPPVSSSS